MRTGTILAGVAGLALAAMPVAAANPASPLSVSSSTRASADRGDSQLAAPGSIIGLILAAAIVAGGIYLLVDKDDDPDSP